MINHRHTFDVFSTSYVAYRDIFSSHVTRVAWKPLQIAINTISSLHRTGMRLRVTVEQNVYFLRQSNYDFNK